MLRIGFRDELGVTNHVRSSLAYLYKNPFRPNILSYYVISRNISKMGKIHQEFKDIACDPCQYGKSEDLWPFAIELFSHTVIFKWPFSLKISRVVNFGLNCTFFKYCVQMWVCFMGNRIVVLMMGDKVFLSDWTFFGQEIFSLDKFWFCG